MKNKTEAVKVTLRPTQIQKVLRVAKKDYEGNFSLTLRVMIDKFKEETCESCKYNGGIVNYDEIQCHNEENVVASEGMWGVFTKGFGCNRWEKLDKLKDIR